MIRVGCILQRLFSTFPNSWPGFGLLLFRLCLAIALLFGIAGFANPLETTALLQESIAAVGGILVLAGLWTPVTGALVAVDEALIAYSTYSSAREQTWIHIFLATLAVSLAMIGPGAWSIDARLFGRRRFDIDRTRGRKPSL